MNHAPLHEIQESDIARFEADGAVCLRGMFDADWVERLRGAVDRSFVDPRASEMSENGRFHTNSFLWKRDADVYAYVFESPAAAIAKTLMRSATARFYYDHLFVKEPGTVESTPWHHDIPYWPVAGAQVCSVWLALDPVDRLSSGLEYVQGSHRWPNRFRPEVWGHKSASAVAEWRAGGLLDSQEAEIPDIEASRGQYEFLSWDCEPGDCLVHHALAVHGSPGNRSTTRRRRALATRWTGDDARYAPRPGSWKPLLDRSLRPGDVLDSPKFPLVIPAT